MTNTSPGWTCTESQPDMAVTLPSGCSIQCRPSAPGWPPASPNAGTRRWPVSVLTVIGSAKRSLRTPPSPPCQRPALTAAGQLVIFSINGRLTGYDDRTGQPRWTSGGLPGQPTIQVAGSLVLVTSNAQGPGITTALTAVLPATGRIAWRFDTGEPLTVLSAGPAG